MDESRRRGEIITLQVGRYANFVGTHFWNFQDELVLLASRDGVVDAPYDHGVLHRPAAEQRTGYGGGQRTPRLVAFDTRDALGSLNPLGLVGGGDADATVTEDAAMSSWGGGVSVFRQPAFKKNALHEYLDNEDTATAADAAAAGGAHAYGGDGGWGEKKNMAGGEDEEMEMEMEMEIHLEEAKVTGGLTRLSKHPFGLDDSVSTWPDFLKSILHPRALQELPFRDESSEFGVYTSGVGGGYGALDESNRDKHSDALRRQLEECDAAQGTQTLVDLEGGWGGLGTSLAKELEEECGNRPRVCYAFLRRDGAPNGPGCRIPGAMGGGGGGVGGGGMGGGAGAARAVVNLALGLHGLTESFSLSFVLDEEACNKETSAYMAIDAVNAYHTSSVLGAALDVATSPLRFSNEGLDAWANADSNGGRGGGGDGGGGVPLARGGVAFGGGGRAAPGADMNLATLSACLPLPYPDASADTLQQLLSLHTSSPPSTSASRDGRGESLTPLYTTASSVQRMIGLGPVARRRKVLLRRGRGRGKLTVAAGAGGDGEADAVLYSRKTVWRGFTAPRDHQLQALEQGLHNSGVGSGCSYSVSTPLPIPITYPLIFRESLGLRGELLSTPPVMPLPPNGGSGSGSMSEAATVSASRGGGGGGAGEMRVMCDQISGVACAERDSGMGSFIGQVTAGLDLRRGGVVLELEKNDMHKDDAIEVLESLTGSSGMPAWQCLSGLARRWKLILLGLALSATTAVTWRTGSEKLKDARARGHSANRKDGIHGDRPWAPRIRTSRRPPPLEGCWIFTHMNKSGGSTIKAMLAKHMRRTRGSFRVYSQLLYGEGEDRLKTFLSQKATVIAGGYTEAFRPLGGGQDCKWFTMFRHPISRVISAYLYCKSEPSELLCGTAVLKANETDFHTFADHWGNYGLRQYALAFVDQDDLLSLEVKQEGCTLECPAWYRAKLYFESLHADSTKQDKPVNDSGLLDGDAAAMASLLEPVTNLLSTRYAAVGILEEWEKSMILLDHALELPMLNWSKPTALSRVVNKGRETFRKEKEDLLRTAWADERLNRSISLDLLLYDHAVGVFQQQMQDHGLME
eukprot:g13823.t1